MTALHHSLTGCPVELPTPEKRYAARLARMRHLIWLAVKTLETIIEDDGGRLIMFTLTYKGVDDWAPRHISNFCKWLRAGGVVHYTWVAELQKRGAVHYHVLARLENGARWTKPGSDAGGWLHGFTWVTDNVKYPLYIMKYLQKGSADGTIPCFPKGLRLYSIAYAVTRRMSFVHSVLYREANLPRWFWEGAEDDIIVRSSFRVGGGVAHKGFRAVSPYTKRDTETFDGELKQVYDDCTGGA